MNNLEKYGGTQHFINESALHADLKLARVIAQHKGLYKITTQDVECFAEISGKFNFQIRKRSMYPAVGDFVMVTPPNEHDRAIIQHILTRKSVFSRPAVGINGQVQIIATNVDIIFICMSLNSNYNLNRLERYLSISWDSGAKPVILLTKADLCDDLQSIRCEVEKVSDLSDVITTSIFDENIEEKLSKYLKQGMTAAFIGSSGVGKSTLINKLLKENVIITNELGKADKGKHTTTSRAMFPTPYGGVVIDTPGMREIGVEPKDLSKSFADIEALSNMCKYNDCTHTTEPDCVVQKAVRDGTIDSRRLKNYFKIKHESEYEGLNAKKIEAIKLERMFKKVGGKKNMRKTLKKSNKRK